MAPWKMIFMYLVILLTYCNYINQSSMSFSTEKVNEMGLLTKKIRNEGQHLGCVRNIPQEVNLERQNKIKIQSQDHDHNLETQVQSLKKL